MINELPDPVLTQVYRLKAVMGPLLDFGDVLAGRRRVVPLVGGTFTGPELNGSLLPGGSASWQIVSPDGTVRLEIRYTLQTDRGALLYVRSSGVGQGNRQVAARCTARGHRPRRAPPPCDDTHRNRRTVLGLAQQGVCSSPSRAARR